MSTAPIRQGLAPNTGLVLEELSVAALDPVTCLLFAAGLFGVGLSIAMIGGKLAPKRMLASFDGRFQGGDRTCVRVCDVRKTADSFDPVANLIQEGRKRMTRHLVRLGGATAIATILLFRPATTDAAVLLPGSVVAPNVLSGSAGTLVDSLTAPLAGVGSITAAVVQNGLGTLDFYYQIVNNAGSGVNLTSNINLLFRSVSQIFATSVFYRTDNGGLGIFSSGDAGATPGSASRDPFGFMVTFGFGATQINPGETCRARDSHLCDDYIPVCRSG